MPVTQNNATHPGRTTAPFTSCRSPERPRRKPVHKRAGYVKGLGCTGNSRAEAPAYSALWHDLDDICWTHFVGQRFQPVHKHSGSGRGVDAAEDSGNEAPAFVTLRRGMPAHGSSSRRAQCLHRCLEARRTDLFSTSRRHPSEQGTLRRLMKIKALPYDT